LSSAKAPKYTYAKLDSLKAGSVVNVYGVVVFFKQTHIRSITLVNTFGFSVVTFDGVKGAPVEPRTSSRSFHFDQDDQRTVEELRSWAATQDLFASVTSTVPLSAVQPKAYFDLTCQLLAKAPVDTTCTLLRVWDGTRCPHTLLKVVVEPHVTEGQLSFSKERENLIADVLVYDNHVEVARKLKVHRGRFDRVLPQNNSMSVVSAGLLDRAFLFNDEHFSSVGWFLCSERSCGHDMQKVTLCEVKRSGLGRVHHVRAQLKAYEPRRLHEALKLYCSKCKSMSQLLCCFFRAFWKSSFKTERWKLENTHKNVT
uniref:Protection of telomeres 1 homolog n=1 Tax=Neolamprologus brichardi TaxID=32507 RepID=A0A3Q4HGE2_NEOBR